MKDIGRMTCNTDTAKNHGLTVQNTRVSIATVRNMGKATTFGTMAPSMMVNGPTIKSKVTESTSGKMGEYSLATG